MDFRFTPEEEQFRAEVRGFLEEIWPDELRRLRMVDPMNPRIMEAAEQFRVEVARRGWFSMGLPEEYGGIPAFNQIERFILSDEASELEAPLPPYLVSIIGPLVVKYGTPWMKNEVLPRIRAGEVDFVFGFTEPENGSDLANLQSRAVRDGDEYVINGQKLYGNPGPGDFMYLAVRTNPDVPKRQGLSVMFVEYGREGFTNTHMPTLQGSQIGATFYDNVRVPADHMLGEENKGWDYIREALDLDRTSGITYGYLRKRWHEVLEHVKHSTVDGKPLMSDPWVRDRVAQMTIELEAGEVLQHMTASKIAANMRLRVESSVVKIFLTELARRVGEFGMELGGPLAPMIGSHELAPMGGELNYVHKSNPGITIAGGSNEIQRNIIALQGLGLPRD